MAHVKRGAGRTSGKQRQDVPAPFAPEQRFDVTRSSLMLGSALMGGIFMVLAGTSGAAAQCAVVNNGPSNASRTVTCSGVDGDGVTATTSSYGFLGVNGGNITANFTTPAVVANVGDAMTLTATAGVAAGGNLTFNMAAGNTIVSTAGNGVLATLRSGGTVNIGGTITGGTNAFALSTVVGTVDVTLAAGSVLDANGGVGLLINRTGFGGTTVTANGVISATDDGIRVSHIGGGAITIANNGSIGGFGVGNSVGGDGIDARVIGVGAITITNTGDIFAAQAGIRTSNTGGATNITNSGSIGALNNAVGGDGIAASVTGAGSITATNNGSIFSGQAGVSASVLGLGNVTVTNNGDISSAGPGVDALSTLGATTITNTGDIRTSGADAAGVQAYAGGSLTINGAGGTIQTAANGGPGMTAVALGDVTIGTTGVINSGSGAADLGPIALVPQLSGVLPTNLSGGVIAISAGAVRVGDQAGGLAGDTITTTGNFGVFGGALGAVSIYTQDGAVDAVNGTGVAGLSIGSDVTIVSGDITSGAGGLDLSFVAPGLTVGGGVVGVSLGGAVDITTQGSTQTTGQFGVLGASLSDTVKITTNGTVVGGALAGVAGIASGDVTIETNASVQGGGAGVFGGSFGGAVGITTNAAVSGGLAGIAAVTDGGAITIAANAEVTSSGVGILAASVDGSVGITTAADVSGALAGVSANTLNGSVNITTGAGTTVTSSGGVGVSALAGGDIAIDTLGSTVNANGPGVLAIGGGAVVVDAGVINAGAGGLGPLSGGALAIGGGDTTVNVQGQISVAGGTFGALAVSTGGAATVNVNATIDPPAVGSAAVTFGAGAATNNVNALVEATAVGAAAANFGSGAVVIDVTSNAEVRTDGVGLLALNIGDGATTVTNRADIGGLTGAAATNGIVVVNGFGDGDVLVDTRGRIETSSDGVNVTKIVGDGTTTVDARGRIIAGGDGVAVNRVGGDGAVSVDFRGRMNAGGDGVSVVHALGDGATDVSVRGFVTAGADGVAVTRVGGDGAVGVDVRGFINAQNNGVSVFRSIGDGAVNVDVASRTRITAATGDGVQVVGLATQGDVTIDVERARITAANGSAIDVITASATGDNNVTVYNDGRLVGAGTLIDPTVRVVADGDVTIDNDASIRTVTNDPAGVAVAALGGGEVSLVNTGYIRGTVLLGSLDLVAPATAASTTFTNSGYWRTEGFSGFGAVNSATVNNSGYIRTSGNTFFGFLSANPNSNHYNNTGVTEVNGTLTIGMIAPNDANFVTNSGTFLVDGTLNAVGGAGLAFNNSNLIDMRDGVTNDRVNVSGTFTGSGASTMAIDASLGGPGSQADRLFAGQATAGVTSLVVQDVNAGPGGFNPQGIVFAYTPTGASALGDFVLDPASSHYDASRGVLDKGLFFYDIATRPGVNNPGGVAQVLIGVPDVELFQTPRALTAAQNLWHETAGGWLDRNVDLRRQLMSAYNAVAADLPVRKGYDTPTIIAMGSGAITPGVWAKAVGSWTNRSDRDTFSVLNRNYAFNTGYNQDVYGVLAGVDFGTRGMHSPNDALVFGAMAGYVSSNLDFKSSPNGFDMSGATVGLYATYLNQGFFVDVLAKADILDTKWRTPSIAGFGSTSTSGDATSYGVRVDSGFRFALNPSVFIEPSATLAYVRTDIDSLTNVGARVDFHNGESLRGALGLRVGSEVIKTDTYTMEASITGRIWNEFQGANRVSVVNLGPTLTFDDKIRGAFGEVAGSLNLFSRTTGWSGFLNGGVKFNDDLTTTTVKGGVRYVW